MKRPKELAVQHCPGGKPPRHFRLSKYMYYEDRTIEATECAPGKWYARIWRFDGPGSRTLEWMDRDVAIARTDVEAFERATAFIDRKKRRDALRQLSVRARLGLADRSTDRTGSS
jgi:class 3 adenylate cyclase